MVKKTIFVDTNILKYAASNLRRFQPRLKTINWGGREFETTVHNIVHINPNNNITNNQNLRFEVELIRDIVLLQNSNNLDFCLNMETEFESWGLPNMDSLDGKLYGASISYIDAPVKYQRIVIGGGIKNNPKDMQFDFIKGIKETRFIEIQKAVGAYQGINKWNRNQLLDAFHLWCAEFNNCDYFLTCEALKLRKQMSNKRNFTFKPKIVMPSELLRVIDNSFLKRIKRQMLKWKVSKQFKNLNQLT